MDLPKTEIVTESKSVEKKVTIPSNFPTETFNKIRSQLSSSHPQGLVFETQKQRNAQYIQKGLSKPGSISYDTLRRSANSVHIARICITVLKEKVTKTKWAIKPIDPLAKVDEAKIKQVEALFKKPNQNDETFRTILDKMLEDLLVLDAVSLEKTRFPDGTLAELHFIDAATIRPVFDEFGNQDVPLPITLRDPVTQMEHTEVMPVSYVQVMDNSQYGGPESGELVAAWEKKDFVYFHMHPQGAMEGIGYGLSPIESVLSVVANILNADNYNGTYFEEGSFPPVILQMVGQMNSEELDAMREYLYQELTGNFHRPAIMAGAGETKVLNLKDLTNNDMQFMQYMQFLARLLAAAYGLSGQDIGLVDDLNKATSEVQKGISEDKGYSSILCLIKAVFNENIIWGDLGYEDIEFDWVADDTQDPKDAATMFDMQLKNGTVTINEVRQKEGKTPYGAWADVPAILTSTGQYVPLEIKKQEEEGEEEGSEAFEDKTADFSKSIYTANGYKTYFDDRGYSQPFIFANVIEGNGFVVKPPVAVNMMSMKLEEEITHQLAERGLNVSVVSRMSLSDVNRQIITDPLVRVEFDKYMAMTPEYDSEKWRAKNGGSRKFPYYLVSSYVDGTPLSSKILIDDMKRDPKSYFKAVDDLAKLWLVEKELVLGDRRADQYIISPDKRAYGFDYQFKGDKQRWKNSSVSIAKVLVNVPDLYDRFVEKTSQKKSLLKTIADKLTKKEETLPIFDQKITASGTFVNSKAEVAKLTTLIEKQSVQAMESAGFQLLSNSYHLDSVSKALQEYVEKHPKSCGGIVAEKDERGTNYLIYVKD